MLSKRIVVKNSMISLITQFTSLILGFVTRSIFLKYLGLEIQGVNSVVGETLSFLSLAELGIGGAITYRLYKPLVEQDEDMIASLMRFYKVAYRIIAGVVFVAGLIMMVFLPVIIKDQTMDFSFIQQVYLIQLITSASSYFFADKRALLYADQKQYICKIIDLITNVVFSLLRIFVMVNYQSYILYLILQLVQSIISNVVAAMYCNAGFPYINKKDVKKYENVKEIFTDTKDILFGKIAGYIWSSTDSIVVSAFKGLVVTGGMSNYKYVTNAAKNVLHSITEPIAATIGNFLQVRDKEESFKMFKAYTFFRFVMINITATGLIICADTLVGLCFGEQYVMSRLVTVLIVTDIFIGVIYGPLGDMVNLLGYFSDDKKINFAGAAINIVSSIILVQLMGMPGVLVGTCLSQAFFWITKSILVCRKYFASTKKLAFLWKDYLTYTVIVAVQTILIEYFITGRWKGIYTVPVFIAEVAICIVIPGLIILVFFGGSTEFKYLLNILTKALNKKDKTEGK